MINEPISTLIMLDKVEVLLSTDLSDLIFNYVSLDVLDHDDVVN